EWKIYPREAVACALKSIEEGVARVKLSRQELWDKAVAIIKNAMDSTALLMKKGFISAPPSEEKVLGSQ
ncbi:MAG: malate dehydrogenase, partial [Candidatus Bathyarchaeota archaeon]|nr:malate dehydrogenase [Candidatus Bathyarchaeota archaeon]